MKYKILEREEYAEKLDYRFYIDKCEDESGNIVYCLVARATRDKEEICLFENSVFITYTQANKEITKFLLSRIVEHLWVKVDFCNLENIKIKQLDDGIKINRKTFKITNYYGTHDYESLYGDAISYIFCKWELKEFGDVLKWD